MRKEVSCTPVHAVLEYAEKHGLPSKKLLAGVPYSIDYLRNKHERIEWNEYCTIMSNLRSIWSDEDIVRMGYGITSTIPFRNLVSVARLLFTGPEIYHYWVANARSPGKQFFDCITAAIEQFGRNHIVLSLTLPPDHRYCRELFLITKGSISAATVVMRLGPARVSMRETKEGAIYDIICPTGGGAFSWLRKALVWPFAARTVARELREANESQHERYAQLE